MNVIMLILTFSKEPLIVKRQHPNILPKEDPNPKMNPALNFFTL